MCAEKSPTATTAPHDRARRSRGFTLLEVLVALIIFSIAFGAIAGIFQTSLRQSVTATTLFDATAVAEQQIERLGNEVPLTVSRFSGTAAGGLNWWVDVDLAAPLSENNPVALYRIKVDVSSENRDRSQVTLQTLRIGQAP